MTEQEHPNITVLGEGESISLRDEVEWVIDWLPDEYIGAQIFRFSPTHPMHAGYWLLPVKQRSPNR